MKPYKLSPSDLTFLWDGCRRCFWLKVRHRVQPVSMPMPKIFTKIDQAMRHFFEGRRCEEVLGLSKPGTIRCGQDLKVRSETFAPVGAKATCYFEGKLDALIEFDDGTYAVIDFKTSQASDANHTLYGRQLHAYAYALENPSGGMTRRSPVNFIGLVYFDPATFATNDGTANLVGRASLQQVPRDNAAFESLIAEMLDVLDNDAPPAAGQDCKWCEYRQKARALNF